MSGVIVAMRRTLLSCTSLARNGLIALGTAALAAGRAGPCRRIAVRSERSRPGFDLNHQEIAVLTTALALLGFSVVAAILLMRTRVRAASNEARLRADIRRSAGRGRPVPRAAVRRTADPDLVGGGRQSPADQRRYLAADSGSQHSPQRILAFGTWLPPEPALQMDHAVDALREAGEGFLLNLTTSNGHAIEAMGRAIGGQAIVRIRELSGLRRELAETNLRHKALAGGNRDAARLRRRRALADLGQGRQGRSQLTPMPPMRGRPRPAASPTRSIATSNCSTAATAAIWTAR